jgi:hypothetical protein
MIVVEQQAADKYDVVEISYKSDGQVDEIVEKCGKCGVSREQLEFTEIKD